jgi:antitoxin (DNA-binding transcriptional repressor) of toxin-antitoxin stability system
MAAGGYIDSMRAVGLKALKKKLSEYVRLAASGETVLVTDRDKVVAELVRRVPAGARCLRMHAWPRPCGAAGSRPRSSLPATHRRVRLSLRSAS